MEKQLGLKLTKTMAPFDVLDAGRMAVFLDAGGTPFSIWQAGTFAGAQVVTEAGAFRWNELMTRDPEAATELYGRVLGWAPKVNAKVERIDKNALGGKATLKEITLTLQGIDGPKIHLLLVIPNKGKGPHPVFVGLLEAALASSPTRA